jgi:hypothetical protein
VVEHIGFTDENGAAARTARKSRAAMGQQVGADEGAGLKRDEIWMNRHRALGYCLRMIFPENRFALFRIML